MKSSKDKNDDYDNSAINKKVSIKCENVLN